MVMVMAVVRGPRAYKRVDGSRGRGGDWIDYSFVARGRSTK